MIQKSNWLLTRTAGLFALLAATLWLLVPEFPGPSHHYFRTQDFPATLLILPIIALASFWWPQIRLPDRLPNPFEVLTTAALLVVMLWAGTYLLMLDYPLTRDEHMAIFDAQSFAAGQLAQPLAPEWRDYFAAISPDFLREAPGNALLRSTYLPGNSMMRAGLGAIADPALLNPVLWAIGFVALYDIARRLFSTSPNAVWVVLAIYLLSAQVLVNAMTSYAMTAHLSLNLVWLALFLRDKWWQHILVLAIGAWALGLHQVTYHPLFAGPFVLMLLIQRRWILFSVYSLVYAAAGLFWLSYPAIVLSSFGLQASSGASAGMLGYLEAIWIKAAQIDLARSALMEFNLLRFLVWTPFFILPLLVLAWPNIRRIDSVTFALFLGIVLMLLMRTLLLPYQGHGWGYRSLHGLIGNAAILSGFGYLHWAKHNRERADGTVALFGGVTAFVILPFLLWATHQFVEPYTRLSAAIERQASDFVVVDTTTSRDAVDQVRNRADLTNRPLVFASSRLGNAQLADLCARGSVTWVGAEDITIADLPMRAGTFPGVKHLDLQAFTECLQPFDRSSLK
ncbi:hypothetical protein [Altererythrobacter sp.]|uniref:hypothetical protein n=1 Tax=Altererythrobacter sp. TaxID=1872480 RepID=UPI001B1191E9|nr:hypothetical protein [Altererythrobacter sp.]MBO6944601.1 hypothetical protein [Altererythrobacter sp.]